MVDGVSSSVVKIYMMLTKDFKVSDADAKRIAQDGKIDATEINELVTKHELSAQLAQLLVTNMDVYGKDAKEINEDDVDKFEAVVQKFIQIFKVTDDGPNVPNGMTAEQKVAAKYNKAAGFKMVDLDNALSAGTMIQTDGLDGTPITEKTTYKELSAKINPDLQPYLKAEFAKVLNIKLNDVKDKTAVGAANIGEVSMFFVRLALAAKLQPEYQLELLGLKGIDPSLKPLRPFDGDITKSSILDYVLKVKEEKKPEAAAPAKKKDEETVASAPTPEAKKAEKKKKKGMTW